MSVANPCAFGPASNAVSTCSICSSDSHDRRPSRAAPINASRPPACQAWYHRDAACAVTPNSLATSTCRDPASNMSAARIRCSRNASTSRTTLPRGPADRGEAVMSLIVVRSNPIDRQRLTDKPKDL